MNRFDPHSWCDADQPRQRHLDLALEVDFAARTLAGRVRIHLASPGAGPLDLDGRDLVIESVRTEDGVLIPWSVAESDKVRGDRLRLELPAATSVVEIVYRTSPGALALAGWSRRRPPAASSPSCSASARRSTPAPWCPARTRRASRFTYDARRSPCPRR